LPLALLAFWILKKLLGLDPPFKEILRTIPWFAVASGAEDYMKK
jgi:hypothetical protein